MFLGIHRRNKIDDEKKNPNKDNEFLFRESGILMRRYQNTLYSYLEEFEQRNPDITIKNIDTFAQIAFTAIANIHAEQLGIGASPATWRARLEEFIKICEIAVPEIHAEREQNKKKEKDGNESTYKH